MPREKEEQLSRKDPQDILVISLTNIGDVVLTMPVLDILKRDFPSARISVVVGPKGEGFLRDNPAFHRIYVFHKNRSFKDVLKWFWGLREQKYDLVIDLRNTAMPFFLRTRRRTSPFLLRKKKRHMLDQHLERLSAVHLVKNREADKKALTFSEEDRSVVDGWIKDFGIDRGFAVVSPGAAGEHKRWTVEGFACACDYLIEDCKCPVILIGDERDQDCVAQVRAKMKQEAHDLCGQTTLTQAAALIARAGLVLTNDSAPLHLASYLDVPVVTLFGPTSSDQYGPWGKSGRVIQAQGDCPACQGVKDAAHKCMSNITEEEVCAVLNEMLAVIQKSGV